MSDLAPQKTCVFCYQPIPASDIRRGFEIRLGDKWCWTWACPKCDEARKRTLAPSLEAQHARAYLQQRRK